MKLKGIKYLFLIFDIFKHKASSDINLIFLTDISLWMIFFSYIII